MDFPGNHDRAFAKFQRINREVAAREIGEDQYLGIDYTSDELVFSVVDEYTAGNVSDAQISAGQ